MPQIQKGDTFADGQQVSGARLNQLIDSATILAGLITEQTNLTANTVATGDSVLLYDLSATALREATASDLLNSNLAITTSSITGGANSDITLTPNDAVLVAGSAFTSANGLTVVVTTAVAHGLTVGQIVTTSAGSLAGYNGTHRITAITSSSPFTFTYVITTAGTIGTGTISYTRQGTVKNPEHEIINGNLYVDGSTSIGGTASITGDTTITGNLTIAGTLNQTGGGTQSGNITQTGTVTQTGAVNQSGTVNITGAIQYNGTPVYGLYEIYTFTSNSEGSNFPSLTKPANEIWIVNFNLGRAVGDANVASMKSRIIIASTSTISGSEIFHGSSGSGDYISYYQYANATMLVPVETIFTSKKFEVGINIEYAGNQASEFLVQPNCVLMISKYKTA